MQIFNLFMPRVNLRRQAQWYADGEPPDFSPSDSQVRSPSLPHSVSVSSITISQKRHPPYCISPAEPCKLLHWACAAPAQHPAFWGMLQHS